MLDLLIRREPVLALQTLPPPPNSRAFARRARIYHFIILIAAFRTPHNSVGTTTECIRALYDNKGLWRQAGFAHFRKFPVSPPKTLPAGASLAFPPTLSSDCAPAQSHSIQG
jgi:hypothetical protein